MNVGTQTEIAGDVGGSTGPGATHTPIAFVHSSIPAGARLRMPWQRDFNSLVYVLTGYGSAGPERRPLSSGQLAVFGSGDVVSVEAVDKQDSHSPNLEILVLGGRPIGEPVAAYGPFVMNTEAELHTAIEDYRAGRMGVIPPGALMPHVVRD